MSASPDNRPLPAPTADGPLLAYLIDVLRPMNRTRVKQLLRHGRVSVNGTATTRHDHPLRPGDRVAIARAGSIVTDRSLEVAGIAIVFEDDALIVIDKPAGLLTVATASEKLDTAFARLNAHLTARGLGRPFVVHRLDRETSGLLLFARSAAVRDQLQANWGKVAKTYLAIVEGEPQPAEGVVENFLSEGRDLRVRVTPPGPPLPRGGRNRRPPLPRGGTDSVPPLVRGGRGGGGRWAVTHYRVIASRGPYTLVEVGLETGRKHQIRVHLAGLGCHVIGDAVYGTGSDPAGRLGLHAQRLTFDHPTTGQRLALDSPLPAALRQMVEQEAQG